MSFGSIGLPELLIIALLVLLIFGARRIPEIFRAFGSGIGEFKRGLKDSSSDSSSNPPSGSSGSSDSR